MIEVWHLIIAGVGLGLTIVLAMLRINYSNRNTLNGRISSIDRQVSDQGKTIAVIANDVKWIRKEFDDLSCRKSPKQFCPEQH